MNVNQTACYDGIYRGTKVKAFEKNVLNTEIRFGQFASSFFDRNLTKNFGNVFCFEIYTCEVSWCESADSYEMFPAEKSRINQVLP